MTPDLATTLCGIALRNPVLAASGTFAYGVEFQKLVDLDALGGLVVKGLSREPIEGNPPPRIYETEAGMINSIGLQNIGVRAFVRREAHRHVGDVRRDLRGVGHELPPHASAPARQRDDALRADDVVVQQRRDRQH